MSEHLSGRALADALGVTEGAVRTALKAGRIKREADGKFDLVRCRSDWVRSTEPNRSKVRKSATRAAAATQKPPIAEKVRKKQLAEPPAKQRVAPDDNEQAAVLDLTEERTRLAKEQADHTALKNAALRGELIPADEAERRWSDEMVALRAVMLGAVNDIPAVLPHLSTFDISEIDRVIRARMIKAANERTSRPNDRESEG